MHGVNQRTNSMKNRSIPSFLKGSALGLSAVGLVVAAWAIFFSSASGSSTPSVGPVPSNAFASNGRVDLSKVPDYVPDLNQQGAVIGYSPKTDLFPPTTVPPAASQSPAEPYRAPTAADQAAVEARSIVPVYGSDLQTLVGHMYPGKGFVPLGESPDSVPNLPQSSSNGSG